MPNPESPIPYDNLCKRDYISIVAIRDTILLGDTAMGSLSVEEGFSIDCQYITPREDESKLWVYIYISKKTRVGPFKHKHSGHWEIDINDWKMRVMVPVALPQDSSTVYPPSVQAECHSDDRIHEVEFDAAAWFTQASDKEIMELADCDWGGDYPADEVARYMQDFVPAIRTMLEYTVLTQNTRAACGFEVHVDEKQAQSWILHNRARLLNKLDN